MSQTKIVVIGAGLVGALAGISFARRGYEVIIIDSRPDPRLERNQQGRSINLAVSARGIEAIRSIDPVLANAVIAKSIPMHGRMIHIDGKEESQVYGLFGESIHSIDRSELNINLLSEADNYELVTLKFDHKLLSIDFDAKTISCSTNGGKAVGKDAIHIDERFDFLVGCDGAYSAVRAAMMKRQRMNFSQEYIEHAYLELSIPATNSGGFPLDPGHLHIWPRQQFMLIALPNPDNSFTSTLFAPYTLFDQLTSWQDVLALFEKEFPDALQLLGTDRLKQCWSKNPVSPLIQVKCSPYHYQNKAILLGDATHAMAPFYGQGLNCGFEDLRILNSILDKHSIVPGELSELETVLSEYSATRHEDLLAILDLAMNNYVEMRSSVTSRLYLIRKYIDGCLGRIFSHKWIPMYSMVSFRHDIRYSEVVKRQAMQNSIVNQMLAATIGLTSLSVLVIGWARYGRPSILRDILNTTKSNFLN